MTSNKQLIESYDKIAKDWHKDHQQDDWWIEGTNKFISLLEPGDLVLDVGCGSGTKAKYLEDQHIKVIGIDFSKEQIEIAKKVSPKSEFSIMDLKDANNLKFTFNGVFAQAVLLHIPRKDIKKTIATITHNLEKNGYVYIAVKEKKPGRGEEEIRIENDYGYTYKRFFSYFTIEEILKTLRDLRFETVWQNIKPSGNTRWIGVIAKKQ